MSGSQEKSRGVALLLSLMLVSLIVLLVLFVTVISTSQLRLAGSSTDSSRAFAAADAGIEYALSQINLGLPIDSTTLRLCSNPSPNNWWPPSGLASKTQYCLSVDNPSKPRQITAIGRTTDTGIRRSLEVVLPVFAAVTEMKTICVVPTAGQTGYTLDQFCTNYSPAYAGATGFYGVGGNNSNCGASKPWSATTPLGAGLGASALAPSTSWATNRAVLVQCYK